MVSVNYIILSQFIITQKEYLPKHLIKGYNNKTTIEYKLVGKVLIE